MVDGLAARPPTAPLASALAGDDLPAVATGTRWAWRQRTNRSVTAKRSTGYRWPQVWTATMATTPDGAVNVSARQLHADP